MKTGTATIDINEYDRMIETIRTSNEQYNEICKVVYDFCVKAGENHLDSEIINLMTRTGYSVRMNTSSGEVRFGEGPKLIKIGMK
jgi:hypothetical protein